MPGCQGPVHLLCDIQVCGISVPLGWHIATSSQNVNFFHIKEQVWYDWFVIFKSLCLSMILLVAIGNILLELVIF